MRQKPEDDLVPYYRPGTTEPEMVPRSSVPGGAEEADKPLDERAEDLAEEKPKPASQVTKKAARKK